MPSDQTRDRHTTLMSRMAGKLGADLEDAERRGDLPPELRAEMLTACLGCGNPGGCAVWLDRTPEAEAAPGWCRNRDRLRTLATP